MMTQYEAMREDQAVNTELSWSIPQWCKIPSEKWSRCECGIGRWTGYQREHLVQYYHSADNSGSTWQAICFPLPVHGLTMLANKFKAPQHSDLYILQTYALTIKINH